MLRDYYEQAYGDLARDFHEFSTGRRERLKERVKEGARIRRGFADVAFVSARMADLSNLRMGDTIDVRGELDLATLEPDDVVVELVVSEGERDAIECIRLPFVESTEGTVRTFEGSVRMERSGSYAYGIRVRAALAETFEHPLGDLVLWA